MSVTTDTTQPELDRLDPGAAFEVIDLAGVRIGSGAAMRAPHRHDYHELVWVRSGCGRHRLDGEPVEFPPSSLTIIGRGTMHQFERAGALHGSVVRFTDELLLGGDGAVPGWLLAGCGGRTVTVPAQDADGLEAAIAALGAEADRTRDGRSPEIERHLLSAILLWAERWYDAGRREGADIEHTEIATFRDFTARLERDYTAHHDAGHYADALALPAPVLSRALRSATGRSTKELILDRVMLEAARLLRFGDRNVAEIAHAVGYDDPLYFSRAFKQRRGAAPLAYRAATRGEA